MKLYFPSKTQESTEWQLSYWFGDPKHSLDECVERDLTYASPLYVSVLLAGPEVPQPIKQDIFLGDFPEMTEKGTFIVVMSSIVGQGLFFSDRLFGHYLL
jgi:DNA-directed RNA polymerase subunit beta